MSDKPIFQQQQQPRMQMQQQQRHVGVRLEGTEPVKGLFELVSAEASPSVVPAVSIETPRQTTARGAEVIDLAAVRRARFGQLTN